MLLKLIERVWHCWFAEHRSVGFTSYRLPHGHFRVVRCVTCHQITDVLYLPDNGDKRPVFAVEATPGITAPEPVSLKSYLEK